MTCITTNMRLGARKVVYVFYRMVEMIESTALVVVEVVIPARPFLSPISRVLLFA